MNTISIPRLLVAFALGTVCFNLPLTSQGPPKQPSQETRTLEDTAKRMLSILRSGRPDELLGLMSSEGVVFGLEPPAISMIEIRKQFRQKRGTYCLLFDSSCLRRELEREWKRGGGTGSPPKTLSYRDTLRRGSVKQIRVFGENGQVDVFVDKADPAEHLDGIEMLEFLFTREGGQWKLAAVVYS